MGSSAWLSGACAFLTIAIFTFANGEIRIVDPPNGQIYYQAGANIHIKVACSGDDQPSMCHQAPEASTCTPFVPGTTKNYKAFKENEHIIEYSPKNIAVEAAGVYKITQGAETKSVNLYFVTIQPVNGTLLGENEDVSVQCRVTGIDVKYTVTWIKDDRVFLPFEEPSDVHNETVLNLIGAKPKEVGSYMCIVTPEGTKNNMTAVAFIHSVPFVDKFERSKNLVQGDNVIVDCHVYGFPLPKVSWTRDDKPLKQDNRTTFSSYNGIEGAKLMIRELTMDDRAEYGCVASNEYNSTTQYISIRVKDKYAALWPFLGICAEVLILCTVIFIYEKRRNKKNAEKEKTPEKPSAQNGKGDEVRQRNKNAVKA